MKTIFLLLVLLFVWGGVPSRSYAQGYDYPPAKKINVIDTYFGKEVVDPYRWMENPEDKELLDWLRAQEELTSSVLKGINGRELLVADHQNTLNRRLENEISFPIEKRGATWYYHKQSPGDQVYKIYRHTPEAGDDLLFDPMNFQEGVVFDVIDQSLNADGSLLLLNLSREGKEFPDMYVMDLRTKQMLPHVTPFALGSFSRSHPRAVYYVQYTSDDVFSMENRMNWKVMRHFIGADPSTDKVVASKETNPEFQGTAVDEMMVKTFPSSPYAFFLLPQMLSSKDIFVAPVTELETASPVSWKTFCVKSDEIQEAICRNKQAYCLTTKGNEMGKVIAVDIENPDFENSRVLFEAMDGWKIENIIESKDFLVITLNKNFLESSCYKYDFNTGALSPLTLPLEGTFGLLPASHTSNELVVYHAGWTRFLQLYDFNLDTDELSEGFLYRSLILDGMENLVSKTLEVPSHDGALVPLTVTYDSTLMRGDGSNICMLSGYGSYGINTPPIFRSSELPLLKRGVILAHAHVRGGSEKGLNWYLAGKKANKPNTWKDFNACAEYLIDNRYTSANKMGCEGGSAGGILIGRAITERPDLYRVGMPRVGVIRYVPNRHFASLRAGSLYRTLRADGMLGG